MSVHAEPKNLAEALRWAGNNLNSGDSLAFAEDALAGGAEVEIKLHIRQQDDGQTRVTLTAKECSARRRFRRWTIKPEETPYP